MIMNNIKIAKKKPIEIVPVPTNIDNEPPTAMEVPSMPAPNATGITASGNITAPAIAPTVNEMIMNNIKIAKKKPIEIEVIQITGTDENIKEIKKFCGNWLFEQFHRLKDVEGFFCVCYLGVAIPWYLYSPIMS
jgi:hypothetical protein